MRHDRVSQTSSFPYLGRDLVVSCKARDFLRVFGISGPQDKKIEPRKITKEVKMFLIRLVCGDMPEVEQEALAETSKGRELKKTNIQEGYWHRLMDYVKNKLTGSSRAFDISFSHVSMINKILNEKLDD